MLRRSAILLVALMPVWAGAIEPPPAGWTDCETDMDCAVVKGPCAPIAVNYGIQQQAVEFYKKQAADIRCTKKFWEPTMEGSDARCRLGRCELVGKETTK